VHQTVLVAWGRTLPGPRLGGLADFLLGRGVAVPAVELSGVVLANLGFRLVVSHDLRRFGFGTSGFGAGGGFRPP